MEENQDSQPTLINHAMKWGLIIGLLGVVVTLLMYVIDVTLFANAWTGLFLLVVFLAIISYGVIDYRKQIGGFLSFGKAWQHAFLVFIISGIIGLIFRILLFTVIDPEAAQIAIQASIEQGIAMAERFGANQAALDQAMPDIERRARESFEVSGMIKGFGWGLIFYAVLSLIAAAIGKKKEPEVM